MAFRPLLRQRALAPAVAAVAGAGLAFSSPRIVDAEAPRSDADLDRKPIYDDSPLLTTFPAPTPSDGTSYRPTPTDRLAVQIGYARMALYKQVTRAEDAVNNALTETLRLEHSFTSTIRSLAPPRESGEKVFPGVLYVLVASMAGSIVSRNRNILLRASAPVAVGLTTAYAVLPLTMRNVGNLVWTYEERFPALAQSHLQARERVTRFFETGKAHTAMTVGMVQDKIHDTRENLEGWVRKGN